MNYLIYIKIKRKFISVKSVERNLKLLPRDVNLKLLSPLN